MFELNTVCRKWLEGILGCGILRGLNVRRVSNDVCHINMMYLGGSMLRVSMFFMMLYGVTLFFYHYFTRDIKRKMDKYRRRNSMSVWNEMYWAYQKGDKKARLAYIFYILSVINLMIGFGLFLAVRFK